MKKADLYRIKAGLEEFGEVKGGAFAYKSIKNLELVTKEVEVLNKLREPTETYIKNIQTPLQELVRKYAEVDENDNVIEEITPEGTKIKVDASKQEEFLAERDVLLEKESKLVKAYDKQMEGFEKVIEEDTDIEFIMYVEADIPDNVSVKDLYQIRELLKD